MSKRINTKLYLALTTWNKSFRIFILSSYVIFRAHVTKKSKMNVFSKPITKNLQVSLK